MTTTAPTNEASAIAVRETSGAAIVKAVPIPAQLQELGVRIAEEEGTGLRVIVLPPDVRKAVNLITPVSSWSQADPNWTPTVSLVQLDKDAHTYPLPGKLGLNKQALETLGRCAGVLYTRTARVPAGEMQEGEMWAYRATVGFRRSDGTVDEVTRERGFNREAEQMAIEDDVRKAELWEGGQKTGRPKFDGEDAVAAEARKRWIAELRFGPAKTESKAINRALRAGLGIPASVAAKDLAKPFLVVGFNFTPDYSDPVQRAALIQIAHLRSGQIYGGREVSDELPEIAAGDIPAAATEPPVAPQADDAGRRPADAPAAGEQAGADGYSSPVGAGSSPEPELRRGEPPLVHVPAAVVEAAERTVIPSQGITIAEILAHAEPDEWLLWALSDEGLDVGAERDALELVVRERRPDLLNAHREEAA